jgi:hypothetical protein
VPKLKKIKLIKPKSSIFWTDDEVAILLNNPNKTLNELMTLLPKRNVDSIKFKRLKLGLPKHHKVVKWTEEEISVLKDQGQHLSSTELSALLPRHSIDGIIHKFKRLRIGKIKEFASRHMKKTRKSPNWKDAPPRYKLDHTLIISDLDNETYQILIGSMLGDGGITKHSTGDGYLFKEGHGIKQKEYLLWKKDMLKTFMPTTWHLDYKPAMSTPVHPIFRKLRGEFYNEQKQCKSYIPIEYVEKLDGLGLLIWYLDDGYRGRGNSPTISSVLFNENDLKKTVEIINKNLQLNLYVRVNKKPNKYGNFQKNICFPASDKILNFWQPIFDKYNIPECMRYKIKKPAK